MAIRSDGTLWTWGGNDDGQLGNGTVFENSTPKKVGTAANWTAVSAGRLHSFAVQADNTLWGWGRNIEGQLGDGKNVNVLVPAALP
jgi:hypothetical protein